VATELSSLTAHLTLGRFPCFFFPMFHPIQKPGENWLCPVKLPGVRSISFGTSAKKVVSTDGRSRVKAGGVENMLLIRLKWC
jgi:hypothetical protein